MTTSTSLVPPVIDPGQALLDRRRALLVIAGGILGSRDAAEDVVHDVFEAVLRGGTRFTSAAQADAYLRTAVVNRCRSLFRRRRTRQNYEAAQPRSHPLVPSVGDEVGAHAEVIAALQRLPVRQRTVIVLRYWSDLTFADIADLTGLRPGTARMHASRALSALEKMLKENDNV